MKIKKIAVIVSQFNIDISDRLLNGVLNGLRAHDISEKNYDVVKIPGAFEIPFIAQQLAKKYDGIIALGCVLKGDTDHYKAVCDGVTYGIQKVSLEKNIPIMFGVLMCHTKAQALARSKNDKTNKGYECVSTLMVL